MEIKFKCRNRQVCDLKTLDMYRFLLNHKSTLLVITLWLCSCCELGNWLSSIFILLAIDIYVFCDIGTSIITLSPSGMVSVCPGGQVLLTCERMSGSFLHWAVSVPRLATTRDTIVARTGDISTTDLQFNRLHLTEFNVARTSSSPLTSQLLINNVTTEINGSTIYCSEDGNENGAPAVAVNVIFISGIIIIILKP